MKTVFTNEIVGGFSCDFYSARVLNERNCCNFRHYNRDRSRFILRVNRGGWILLLFMALNTLISANTAGMNREAFLDFNLVIAEINTILNEIKSKNEWRIEKLEKLSANQIGTNQSSHRENAENLRYLLKEILEHPNKGIEQELQEALEAVVKTRSPVLGIMDKEISINIEWAKSVKIKFKSIGKKISELERIVHTLGTEEIAERQARRQAVKSEMRGIYRIVGVLHVNGANGDDLERIRSTLDSHIGIARTKIPSNDKVAKELKKYRQSFEVIIDQFDNTCNQLKKLRDRFEDLKRQSLWAEVDVIVSPFVKKIGFNN